MSKKTLLFAPAAFNFAETSRMVEIAKGIRDHEAASQVFDIQFITDSDDFEFLIVEEGFPCKRLQPRLTKAQIDHIAKVDKAEKFGFAFSKQGMIEKIDSEIEYLRGLKPAAVITGSYVTIPVTCRVLNIPLVWVIQSTWLKDFFGRGAGFTDGITFAPAKKIVDFLILLFINLWVYIGFVYPVNKAARHYGVDGYKSIFDFWRGNLTLVAEPAEFTGIELPPEHYYTGPLIAQHDFPIPDFIKNIPRDKPLIYFAMGSSGTPEIVANILESFEGKPYRVIAPIKWLVERVPNVKVPENVIVTDWLPAHEVNKLADLSLIHGGIGTVMTAAYAGKPVVGVGMQPEQNANIACLVRKGFAIRVPKSRNPSSKVQKAIQLLLSDDEAIRKAKAFAKIMAQWNGPKVTAQLLYEKFSE